MDKMTKIKLNFIYVVVSAVTTKILRYTKNSWVCVIIYVIIAFVLVI